MGRRKLTVVRLLQPSDLEMFNQAEELFGSRSNDATRSRILKEYLSFLSINDLGVGEGLKFWVGQQRSAKVQWSSLDTYVGYIYSALSGRIPLDQLSHWDHVSAIVSAAHAAQKTASAVTAERSALDDLKEHMEANHHFACQLIRYTGARLADIRRWRHDQMVFTRRRIRVEVRITKGRRARKKRRILRLRTEAIFGKKLPLDLVRRVKLGVGEVLDRSITINSLNRSLRFACNQLGWPRGKKVLTTYSFRHRFIHDVLEFVDYDYDAALKYTLHCGVDILAAHYDKLEYRN
jgi:hypothetical protein